MGRINRADSTQEAELLARANDQAVEVGGRLADVLAVTVAYVREERRGPWALPPPMITMPVVLATSVIVGRIGIVTTSTPGAPPLPEAIESR